MKTFKKKINTLSSEVGTVKEESTDAHPFYDGDIACQRFAFHKVLTL